MAVKVSAKDLLAAGAHFGHQSRRWNPKMSPYLYGVQDGVHVFDLIKTKEALEEALKEIEKAVKEGKKILLIGTKKQVKDKVKEVALSTGCFYVNERWLGGTLTNFDQIKKSTAKLADYKKKREKGEFKSFTKKERLLIDREIARLERFFSGIAGLEENPDLMIVIDIKRESSAIREAKARKVKTIGIVDSNCDPTHVDYPIPMNDDATRALEYVLNLIKDTILNAKKKTKVKKTKSSKK